MSVEEDIASDGSDTEMMDEEEMEGGMMRPTDFFFKGVITADEPLVVSSEHSLYFIKITSVSMSVNAPKGSRTAVLVENQTDDDKATLCVLNQGSMESFRADLLSSDALRLSVAGTRPSEVHVTGYYVPIENSLSDPNALNALMAEGMESMDDFEGDEVEMSAEEEKEMMRQMQLQSRKRKRHEVEDEDIDEDALAEVNSEEAPELVIEDTKAAKRKKGNDGKAKVQTPASPKASKKQSKKEKKAAAKAAKEAAAAKSVETQPPKSKRSKKWKQLGGGLRFKDVKQGSGNAAKNGDKVTVYYVGQLDDKSVFDKTITGEGFSFNLGAGDVIVGWDKAVKGMAVGGKRRVEVPPKMGYGASGAPPEIPPNAKLTFTVEMKKIR